MATLATELEALLREFGPTSGFDISHTSVRRSGETVALSGALPETLHFGVMSLDLATGVLTFVDQDHRDGGDWELKRVTLPPARVEAVKAAR